MMTREIIKIQMFEKENKTSKSKVREKLNPKINCSQLFFYRIKIYINIEKTQE